MRILLFAGLAEAAGRGELELPEDCRPESVGELVAAVRARWPALAGHTFRVAVNRSYRRDADPVGSGDEVAFIPPVSGG